MCDKVKSEIKPCKISDKYDNISGKMKTVKVSSVQSSCSKIIFIHLNKFGLDSTFIPWWIDENYSELRFKNNMEKKESLQL